MITGGLLRRLDLATLRLVIAVHEEKSLRGAASREAIAASAASKRLTQLERSLGIKLFLRHGRGMQLTKAGDALRRHAEQIMAVVERIGTDLRANLDGHAD
jgi:DNA-binding transcriptional LysR family regulator